MGGGPCLAADRPGPRCGGGRRAIADGGGHLAANRILSGHGADWIVKAVGGGADEPVRVLTHERRGPRHHRLGNRTRRGARELHERGTLGRVYANETRPLLQGGASPAWELARLGIDHVVQVDAAAASTIVGGRVDVAVAGADRIAANGDAANKIGTLGVALACVDAGIPFVVAAPMSTVDGGTATGRDILHRAPRRRRGGDPGGMATVPSGSPGFNPAFDVTPARLISAISTEAGVVEPSDGGRGALHGGGVAADLRR